MFPNFSRNRAELLGYFNSLKTVPEKNPEKFENKFFLLGKELIDVLNFRTDRQTNLAGEKS